MRFLIELQRFIAIIVLVIGFVLMISETPISEGFGAQAWLTIGGLGIILLSIGWLWLISKEEGYFLHETS